MEQTTPRNGMTAKQKREIATAEDLLGFVATAEMPAIDSFSVAEKIRVGETDGVKIGWIGNNFRRAFGSLMETNIPSATLRINRLKKGSVDSPIIDEYGGTELAAGFIAYMFEMMKKQGHGKQGVLLTNYHANVIHVPDPGDPKKVCAVGFDWFSGSGHWRIEAYPITDPDEWHTDDQFVSLDSGSQNL